MADWSIDFKAQGNSNPWTLPSDLISVYGGNWQVATATGLAALTGDSSYRSLCHNAAYGSLITAEMTIGTYDFNDQQWLVIMARSGANAGKGYRLKPNSTNRLYLYREDAAAYSTTTTLVDGNWATTTGTWAAGDKIRLIYNTATGALDGYYNQAGAGWTLARSATDTTYQAETVLAPGVGYLSGNNGHTGWIADLSGTGLSGGAPVLMGASVM